MNRKTLVYAHRGASKVAPENSMSAFKLAKDMGADGIETDVMFSKDGHIMVHHDFELGRCEEGTGRIKDYTYFELRQMDIGSKFDEKFKGEKMPCIEETLKFCKENNLKLNIELKTGSPYDAGIEEKLVEIVKNYDMEESVVYSSFNHYSLMFVKKICKNAKVAALTGCVMVNPWEYLKLHDIDGYHPHYLTINDKVVSKMQHKDLFINAYTVDEEEYLQKMFACKVDGVITNVPDLAIKIRDEK
ncbi:MAG: glycerophosphodiester phosphodiesterase [Clostridia bacterium]|nr:glycerophosphodiester phosphodiesterase [Clostridia bacterium]